MKIATISTASIYSGLRRETAALQSQLVRAQSEAVTGQLADPGNVLGARNGARIALQRDVQALGTIEVTNELAISKVDVSQASLQALSEVGVQLIPALTASIGQGTAASAGRQAAESALSQVTSLVNATFNGDHVFAGINSSEPPLQDFDSSNAQQVFDQTFINTFGFSKTDPAAAQISGAALSDFINDDLMPAFTGNGWTANISSASDTQVLARTGLSSTQTVTTSANAEGIQKMYLASVLGSEFLSGSFNSGAQDVALKEAVGLVASAGAALAQQQAQAGQIKSDLTRANEHLAAQSSILESYVGEITAVDPFEAANRVNTLLTQIETSFALTARIQQLSLLRYL